MVDEQLRARDIADERVLAAMERVPRELFVPESVRDRAYDDAALPIGEGQTISQPYMVARICEALALGGTSACSTSGPAPGTRRRCSRSWPARCTRSSGMPSLAERARAASTPPATSASVVHVGDGTLGDPEHAPFGAIAVAAAAPDIPPSLYEQLVPNGRLVVPVGGRARPGAPARRPQPGGPAARRASPAASSRSSAPRASPPNERGTLAPWHARPQLVSRPRAAGRALRRPENWLELLKFSVVGASGYVINLAVYVALLKGAGMHYLPAAACSFVVAVDEQLRVEPALDLPRRAREHLLPGAALPARLGVALGLNLLILRGLVALDVGKIAAQAIAIILVTPFSFSVNKLWSFRR